MSRKYFISPLLIILLLQTSCSYRYYYVIVNASNQSLLVEYRFKEHPDADERKKKGFLKERYYYFPPAMISLDDLSKQKGEWKNVLETNFSMNEETGEIEITIAAGDVLKIYQDSGYARSSNGNNNFPIAAMSLTGEAGRISFEGKMVYKQFIKLHGTTYQVRYE